MSTAVASLTAVIGTRAACRVLAVSRAGHYRRSTPPQQRRPRARPARALAADERQHVLDTLHSERFLDQAPAAVYASLLDEGRYLCSERTMYRLLAAEQEGHERRNQTRHPQYARPELLATAPNQVWSWDITKLRGPAQWTYFYLYVILAVFSRAAVGWLVAHRERAELAKRFSEETARRRQ